MSRNDPADPGVHDCLFLPARNCLKRSRVFPGIGRGRRRRFDDVAANHPRRGAKAMRRAEGEEEGRQRGAEPCQRTRNRRATPKAGRRGDPGHVNCADGSSYEDGEKIGSAEPAMECRGGRPRSCEENCAGAEQQGERTCRRGVRRATICEASEACSGENRSGGTSTR